MSSILTNTSSMVALQTLRGINSNLQDVQSQISTGKKVGSAKDNAAVWAISKSMEADVKGFKAISESLSLGQSTVAVARQASESVTDLLTDIKQKIVASQEDNVDRDKIQTDIDAMTQQIGAIVGAAQFNGSNLLQNTDTTAGSDKSSILSSLDRTATGVTASDISVTKQDLGIGKHSIAATGGAFSANEATATLNATPSATVDLSAVTVAAGKGFALQIYGTAAGGNFTQSDYRNTALTSMTQAEAAASASLSYVAREGDTVEVVASKLADQWSSYASAKGLSKDDLSISATASGLSIASNVTDADDVIAVTVASVVSTDNTIGGGLETLANIDVRTETGADDALDKIEGLIQTSIDAAASFGSAQGRLETQADFISGLSDSLKSGIGALVDADMEEASARLQALQVQQQLGVQALSIANQAPQSILSLFR